MNKALDLKSLEELAVDSSFTRELPGDPVRENFRRQVAGACYSHVDPVQFPKAELIAYSKEIALELGIDLSSCESDQFTRVFSGSELLQNMTPYACCYGGHQFGNWAGQLGDGRAINLGEVTGTSGMHWTLQLKGSGPTPYSRTADGLAVLRSSVREFLCSEAMHHLGVPTTRALSLMGTGESVVRDMFYDGHPKHEPGAVVCRVAPTFTRFGSFEIFTARKDLDTLKRLADYTIKRDFSQLNGIENPDKDTYLAWFRDISLRTADLIVHWMRVGFVHGVMNTDNMSITGMTIDYGPYGWLENYDPDWTPNTTDAEGRRYRFGNQPMIALWNLVQLANALYPLVEQTQPFEEILQEYKTHYEKGWLAMM
ncbi:MAG: YdiU family protein, partial [Gammaproteobacteria bacterium]